MQGMVARSELLDALSEAKANIEDTTVLTSTNARLQEQVETAREELANLKDAMHKMVQAADLESERKKSKDLEQAARAERQKFEDSIAALNEKLRALSSEKAALAAEIQVRSGATHLNSVACAE
jgi:predicted  nucleic acid-binding Zn-ribbon protein